MTAFSTCKASTFSNADLSSLKKSSCSIECRITQGRIDMTSESERECVTPVKLLDSYGASSDVSSTSCPPHCVPSSPLYFALAHPTGAKKNTELFRSNESSFPKGNKVKKET
ncbi:hypothetical protein AVEN_186064-1 [Araneus ventricosus]|uniref:Uncharacterized protein n=1 Tax=Araneus ventricosus TaxID=182803 RepID=A0A4Y2K1H8_ARAVE|nr:hypothetical protein AVEN_186064-1 [Araneus ventricosus]